MPKRILRGQVTSDSNDKTITVLVEIKKLLNEGNYLDEILSNGYEKANEIASKKMKNSTDWTNFRRGKRDN